MKGLLVAAFVSLCGRAGAQTNGQTWTLAAYAAAAQAASPDVSQARAGAESAAARWRADLSDSILPQLSASANAYPYGQNPLNSYKFNSWQASRHSTALNAGATWNLFNSFSDTLKLRSSHAVRESAQKDLENALQTQTLKAVRAFFDLMLDNKLVEVSSENLKAQQEQFRLTTDLYKHGMKSLSDLLKTETDLRSSELGLAGAEADRRLALFRFNALLDREGREEAVLADSAPDNAPLPDLDQDMRRAPTLRPELAKGRLDAERARTALLQSLQGSLPSLNFGFQWTYQESASFGQPSSNYGIVNPNHQFFLALTLPVGFNFFSQFERFSAARSDEKASRDALRALTRSVREEVFSAHNDLTRSRRSYDVSLRKTEIAKQNLDVVFQQYRQGSADVIRLSQAQLDYVNAQVENVRALHDANISRAEYRRAVGEPLWR